MTCVGSCSSLFGWCARLWFLAAPEALDDAHHTATIRAWFLECEGDDLCVRLWFLFGLLRPKQASELCDTGLSTGAGQQTVMPYAAEPIWQYMNQKASDELTRHKAHGLMFVTSFDAIVFPLERDGVGIGTYEAAV